MPRLRVLPLALAGLLTLAPAAGRAADADGTRHYGPNHNFDRQGRYLPAGVGFDLADIGDATQLDRLPPGVLGMAWIGLCDGVDDAFLRAVRPYAGHRNLYGFYLMDDPDPGAQCPPARLRVEADWIHAHFPGAVTFIALMNLGTARSPSYRGGYDPENSHVDLFGIAPYPCRTSWSGCDFGIIDTYVAAAEAAGVPRRAIAPIFQTFGDGGWRDGEGGRYLMPTPVQAQEILHRWRVLIPHPPMDMSYSWGSQRSDTALENAGSALQAVLARHNREGKTNRP